MIFHEALRRWRICYKHNWTQPLKSRGNRNICFWSKGIKKFSKIVRLTITRLMSLSNAIRNKLSCSKVLPSMTMPTHPPWTTYFENGMPLETHYNPLIPSWDKHPIFTETWKHKDPLYEKLTTPLAPLLLTFLVWTLSLTKFEQKEIVMIRLSVESLHPVFDSLYYNNDHFIIKT